MKARILAAVAVAALSLHGVPVRADDDDKAVLAKLDAIEKRLGNIETLMKAQGAKTPFSITLPVGTVADQGKLCASFGYSASDTKPSLPAPPASAQSPTVLTCYGSPAP